MVHAPGWHGIAGGTRHVLMDMTVNQVLLYIKQRLTKDMEMLKPHG